MDEQRKSSKIKCRKCKTFKAVWYFRIRSDTGNRRTVCKLCERKRNQENKTKHTDRYNGVFDGLDWASDKEFHEVLASRISAVRSIIIYEKLDKKRSNSVAKRTIADEIEAGKSVWRSIRRLARAPMPLVPLDKKV